MVKTFRPQERQEIKAFLDSLLAGPAAVDSQAVEAAFWDRLRPLLAANDQSQGLVQLDVLGQAVLEGQPGAALDGPVFLLPPVAGVAARSQSPPRSSAKGKGKAKMPARRSSKRTSASSPTTAVKKPKTASPPSSPRKSDAVSLLELSRSAPKDVRVAFAAILAEAQAQGKNLWRLAYPWVGRTLWYDPVEFAAVYREHWRLFMAFRHVFWSWALHAPLQKSASELRRKLKLNAIQDRLRFISFCIETWGWYDFLERLDGHDGLFWYGGQPGKGASGV